MPTFTPQQRKDITRRQLRIDAENAAYAVTTASLNSEKQKLFNVDNANAAFYDIFRDRAASYEAEALLIDGAQSAQYTEGTIDPYVAGDFSTSAKTPGSAGALFFPSSPVYVGFTPKVVDAVNGYLNPTGTASRYEQNILTNATVHDGLQEMIFRLTNGITGSVSAATTSATDLPAGDVSGLVLTVTSAVTNFTVGELVYINVGAVSGVYQITAKQTSPNRLTVSSVIPTLVGTSTTFTIDNTVAAFTPTERQNLTSASYQELLTNIANRIDALVAEWETNIDSQSTAISGNNEERATQVGQNAAAAFDINNSKVIIDTWQARSATGASGRFIAASIAPISAEITARLSFTATRITQIVTALGNVSQTGDVYSGVVGSPYYERYRWLNIRLNRASGSARRFFAADEGIQYLLMLAADNTALKSQYDSYFLTRQITALDETTIIQIRDVVGISVGDNMSIISETQPEIQRAVMEIMGTTQVRLDKAVPNTYIVNQDELTRIFKQL